MRFTELICRQALRLAETQARNGVRLSPVHLDPEEAPQLVEIAREVLGERWYVVVAVPGAAPALGERYCIDPGERAAEYATRWRNTLDSVRGERVLYVSVEQQGKAGGLQDILMALGEEALQAGFTEWLQGSALPRNLSKALMAAGVTEHASARELCRYSELILAEEEEDRRWAVAGEQLPVVSLAKDSKLQIDPEARLKGNKRLVQRAAMSERQSSSLAPAVVRLEGKLKDALRSVRAGTSEDALREVDIAGLSVQDLDSDTKKSAKKPKAAATRQLAPPPKRPAAPARSRAPAEPPAAAPRSQEEALASALEEAPAKQKGTPAPAAEPSSARARRAASATAGALERESLSGEGAGVARAAEAPDPTPAPAPASAIAEAEAPAPALLAEPQTSVSRSSSPGTSSGTDGDVISSGSDARPDAASAIEEAPWTESMQRREFGFLLAPLPSGLAAMLDALLAAPAGLTWTCTGIAGSLLQRLPQALKDPEADGLEPPEGAPWATALQGYHAARKGLVEVLRAASHRSDHLVRLIRAPLLALSERALRSAAVAHISALESLYGAIAAEREPDLLRRALALETCTIRSSSGETLCLLSPLHPLWLGQALARYESLSSASDLSPVSRRLVARALSQAPLAPASWPIEGSELRRGLPFTGLPLFEAAPSELSEAGLQSMAARLVSLFLAAAPHARAGLHVTIRARNPAPLLDGLADVLRDTEDLQRIDVSLDRSGTTAPSDPRLRLLPTTIGQAGAVPHIHITVLDRLPQRPIDPGDLPVPERPLLAARRAGSSGIVSVTSVVGVPGLAAVEAALAGARGEQPRGAFVEVEAAASVREVIPREPPSEATWLVAVAPVLSPQIPSGSLLLVNERLDGFDVAVVAGDERAPARCMEGALRAIGVQNTRTSVLTGIAQRLAGSGSGGILTLGGEPERQLGSQILSAKLAEVAGEGAVTAQIRGSVYPALLGGQAEDDPYGTFGLSVAPRPGGGLRIAVGYAALQRPLAVEFSGSRISGELWDRLVRLAEVVRLAAEDSLGGAAAREALGAVLWPAIVAELRLPEALSASLAALGPETQLDLAILCLLPQGHALIEAQRETLIRGTAVEIAAIDAELMQRLLLGRRR